MTDGERVSAPSCEARYDDTGQGSRQAVVNGSAKALSMLRLAMRGSRSMRMAGKGNVTVAVCRVVAWTTERAQVGR